MSTTTAILSDVRCLSCNRLLMRANFRGETISAAEIRCPRCRTTLRVEGNDHRAFLVQVDSTSDPEAIGVRMRELWA